MATPELLSDGLLQDVVALARDAEPAAIAVLLRGSHARGIADAHSDLDLTVITAEESRVPYALWFVDRLGLPALPVSCGARSVESWLQRGREPASWALGLAATEDARYLWHDGCAVDLLGDPPSRHHPADIPELEDFVEAAVKAARGRRTGDPILVRVNARIAAELVPRLLLSLNPGRVARDRRDALRLALAFESVPAGYGDDLANCLGATASDDAVIEAAIERLALGVLAFVREHDPKVDPQLGVTENLVNGALKRHVERAFGES